MPHTDRPPLRRMRPSLKSMSQPALGSHVILVKSVKIRRVAVSLETTVSSVDRATESVRASLVNAANLTARLRSAGSRATQMGIVHSPLCVESIYGQGCLPRCTDREPCSPNWVCRLRQSDGSLSACVPDCREAGCAGQLGCNHETGMCELADIPCVPECQVGESCTFGRCVRPSGLCDTDFHCPPGRTCHGGQCVMVVGETCAIDDDCDAQHSCTRKSDTISVCELRCARNGECPLNHVCDGLTQTCRLSVCGHSDQQPQLYEVCEFPNWVRARRVSHLMAIRRQGMRGLSAIASKPERPQSMSRVMLKVGDER